MLDLNRNIKVTVGNLSIPTRLFGPRELFGRSLITHFDATDYKNYSLSALTYVPIPQTGLTLAPAAYDTSFNRRRYNYATLPGNSTEANNLWVGYPTGNFNYFTGSTFDTNKGSLGYYQQGATMAIQLYTPYSGNNNLAPNSAVTLGFYSFLNPTQTNHIGFGPTRFQIGNSLGNNIFGFSYTSNTGNRAAFYGKTGTTGNVRISNAIDITTYTLKHNMFLFTITGSNYYWYINNNLIDSGTLGAGIVSPNLFYPFTGSTSAIGNFLSMDGAIQGNSNPCEFFIASEYTLPEQVNLLYDYFIIKFKNKIGRYR